MLVKQALLGLPTSLLVLALAQQTQADAHNVDEQQQQRDDKGRAQQSQPQIIPLAIRKMSLDEGEKFYPENDYGFEIYDDGTSENERRRSARAPDTIDSFGRSLGSLFSFGRRAPSIAMTPSIRSDKRTDEEEETHTNSSISTDGALLPQAYLPPFSIHQGHEHEVVEVERGQREDGAAGMAHELYRRASEALAHLQRRQWACPSGTASCSDIGYPYSCCSTGETCYVVTDTGLGPVGCCPSGSTCGGAVTSCSSSSTACPSSLGGGCCIEGYACAGIGCVKVGSSSTTTIARTSATSSTPTPTTSISTSTTTPSTSSTSTSSTTFTGSSGVAPVKPTGTDTDSSLPSGYCPTGYYACLAVAGGGCCQTGRDCQTTSCAPAAASTTIVNTNGITVVVPESAASAAAAAATAASTCASGWFMCGTNSASASASAGPVAGCCPSGYSCGTASCTMTSASSTAQVQKELPTTSSSGQRVAVSMGLVLSLALAVVMW